MPAMKVEEAAVIIMSESSIVHMMTTFITFPEVEPKHIAANTNYCK